MKNKWIVPLLVLIGMMLACNMPADQIASSNAAPDGAATPTFDLPGQSGGGGPYPLTPEEVVHSFITISQDDPVAATEYLSQARTDQVKESGAADLLALSGDIDAFAVESSSFSPEPLAAEVVVGIKMGERETRRTFELVVQDGRWVIDEITS
ncbi:MAG: hypothetical protein GYA17_22220 [Chloroflexi bacterium]|nr:hypothetical protein [Anaerolineaceae bacterium]NMB91086.1 hypothetical protein [Chloroflexota bacterium]